MVLQKKSIMFLLIVVGVNLFQPALSFGLDKYSDDMIPPWAVDDESERKLGFGADFDIIDLLKRELATFRETNNFADPFHTDNRLEELKSVRTTIDNFLLKTFNIRIDDVLDGTTDIYIKLRMLMQKNGFDFNALNQNVQSLVQWLLRLRHSLMQTPNFGDFNYLQMIDSVAKIVFRLSKWIGNRIEVNERRVSRP